MLTDPTLIESRNKCVSLVAALFEHHCFLVTFENNQFPQWSEFLQKDPNLSRFNACPISSFVKRMFVKD